VTGSGVELWTMGAGYPSTAARIAAGAEAAGWDGIVFVDSQNLSSDSYVNLAVAAGATTKLRLGTGVTNPATRHPAVAAAAIASVHHASGGRAVIGIGRGDSALAHLGIAPAPVDELERYVRILRAYLLGETVTFEDLAPYHREGARPITALGLADSPTDSRLHWLDRGLSAVPVEVVATGPRMLAMAARHADRVLLAVGADLSRVSWAVEKVRAVNPEVPIAAFVNVVVHDDPDVAFRLGAGGLATFARFSVMDGKVRTPIDDSGREQLSRLHAAYDMNSHTRAQSSQAATLDPDFVKQFGIVGPAGACVERLAKLSELGIDRFTVIGPSIDADPVEARRAREAMVTEVLPAVRASL
jgi:5,10-methylenetetrahydromethanopterin reductase